MAKREKKLKTIASAWDLEIKVSEDGTEYMVGFDDNEERDCIIAAERLNGNKLVRFKDGLTLV